MKLPSNTHFLSRHHKLLWNLAVLLKLETLLQSYPEKFEAKGITDLSGLLLSMGIPPVRIPSVLCGVETIRHYQRQKLVDLCDPFAKERSQLSKELELLRRDKRYEETTPLSHPSLENFEKQQAKVSALKAKIHELQLKMDGLGERNTVPQDLYRHGTVDDLVALGFVEDGKPLPRFTHKGWEVYSTAVGLNDHMISTLRRGGEASVELNNSTWQRIKGMYVTGV